MPSPSFAFAFALSTLYGIVFYLVFGHGWMRLFFYWAIGVAGFFLGQWAANAIGLNLLNLGEVNLVEGTLVSWICLFTVRAWRR
ncbi:MAG: hypothetical protein KGJ80_07765 [Chloroflexota bacterium]|nr:hypothetical protein [Chloroflexota bacterium]